VRERERAAELASAPGITIEHIAKNHIPKEDVLARVLVVRGDRPGLVHIGQRGEKRGGATEVRKFLGFSISNDPSERRIAPKVLDKFKMQIREMTRRTRAISPQRLIEELTPYIIGWRGYFGFCQTTRVLANLEAWIRKVLKLIPQGAAIAP
jgi:hypothetical protein